MGILPPKVHPFVMAALPWTIFIGVLLLLFLLRDVERLKEIIQFIGGVGTISTLGGAIAVA